MCNENSEAPAALTVGASNLPVNYCEKTNMNIVAKSNLNFHGIQLQPVANLNDVWLSSSDIAKALGYASSKSVSTIYSRNADEFTDAMSMVIKMKTIGINNNLRDKSVRVFSLRGCHLIAMFANTSVAKEFRRWVLDILDREVTNSPIAKKFSDAELCQLAWVWDIGNRMQDFAKELAPAMYSMKSAHAGKFHDFGKEFRWTFEEARKAIENATQHIPYQPERDDNWSRVLPRLRKELH
ncbi:P22AR C-terminal domain-containing protein [Pantoea dispersa]|uniref:Bro-N domain-containing protein n=1 Tax=Pantoea dispersa TaxID=59814 RepID=A0ABY3A2U2_9GAMM|nr:P22AR C-terminal domain-containing protein [Pantoea dispersa]TQC75555.1 hypothetical protein FK492_06440 [Pantoea dispersa]